MGRSKKGSGDAPDEGEEARGSTSDGINISPETSMVEQGTTGRFLVLLVHHPSCCDGFD